MAKRYDRAYFDRWYRDPRHAVILEGVLERRVKLALSAAEYLLERPVRRVLDVGCGEAPWRRVLRRLRPRLAYTGVDSSEYVVARYGRRRGIRRGTVGELGRLGLQGPYDLIVCSDVLHYVPTREVRAGLRAIARLLGGLAFLEAFAAGDPIEGDRRGLQARSAAHYRRLFREAGLTPVGLHSYVGRRIAGQLVALESPAPGHRGPARRASAMAPRGRRL